MKPVDCFFETVSLDESHSVKRPSVVVVPEAVNRHDAGMFETTGDLGFAQKASPALRVIGMPILDLL
jgi:hypothetical protein